MCGGAALIYPANKLHGAPRNEAQCEERRLACQEVSRTAERQSSAEKKCSLLDVAPRLLAQERFGAASLLNDVRCEIRALLRPAGEIVAAVAAKGLGWIVETADRAGLAHFVPVETLRELIHSKSTVAPVHLMEA